MVGFVDLTTGDVSDCIDAGFNSPHGDGGAYTLRDDTAAIISSVPNGQCIRVMDTRGNVPRFITPTVVFRQAPGICNSVACNSGNLIFVVCTRNASLHYDIMRWTGSRMITTSAGTLKSDPTSSMEATVTSLATVGTRLANALMTWSSVNEDERFCLSNVRFDQMRKDQIDVQFSDSIPIGGAPNHQHAVVFPDLSGLVAYHVKDRKTVEFSRVTNITKTPEVEKVYTFNYSVDWMDLVRRDDTHAMFFYCPEGSSDVKCRTLTLSPDRVRMTGESNFANDRDLYQGTYVEDGMILLALKDEDDLVLEKVTY